MKTLQKYFILFAMLVAFIPAIAQTNPLDKKLEKAKKYIQENKYDDAAAYLEKLLADNPQYGEGWDLLVDVRYLLYEESKNKPDIFGNIQVVAKSKDGKDVSNENDSLAKQLVAAFKQLSPSKIAYNKFMYTTRKATALTDDAYKSSMYLRALNFNEDVDTNLNSKAVKYFREAESEFSDKNYNKAALLYRRAIEVQPDFYKASLYLGDCYYYTENYTEALTAFKEAARKFPNLLEPRKYITDTYYKLKLYGKAYDEALNTFALYLDHSMVQKLYDAAYLNGQRVKIAWTPRQVLPNKIVDTATLDLNKNDDMQAIGPWVIYQGAFNKIKPYCNDKGMITKANSLTQSKYMEVFAWEEMLKNSTDKSLEQAREMQRQGYLDCYVLVTCFHYDFYDQYHDFALRNKERITKYYKAFTHDQ